MKVKGYRPITKQSYVQQNPGKYKVIIQAIHVADCEVFISSLEDSDALDGVTVRAALPQRAALAVNGALPEAFEICVAPNDLKEVRQGMVAILKSKIINDISPMNAVLSQLRQTYNSDLGPDIQVEDVVRALVSRSGNATADLP